MACPTCGCRKFYIKDPQDEYEIIEFEYASGGNILVDESTTQETVPSIDETAEIFCDCCAWHGSLKDVD